MQPQILVIEACKHFILFVAPIKSFKYLTQNVSCQQNCPLLMQQSKCIQRIQILSVNYFVLKLNVYCGHKGHSIRSIVIPYYCGQKVMCLLNEKFFFILVNQFYSLQSNPLSMKYTYTNVFSAFFDSAFISPIDSKRVPRSALLSFGNS